MKSALALVRRTPPGDDRAEAEQRGEVENVRAEHHADAELVLTSGKRGDGGRNLRRVCSQRCHDPEQTFRELQAGPDFLQDAGQDIARDRHERD